ncbi:MAG: hypothetical protein NC102_08455 [Clostridium sp.]|nr:hypothetical protein [Clostridium sp.]
MKFKFLLLPLVFFFSLNLLSAKEPAIKIGEFDGMIADFTGRPSTSLVNTYNAYAPFELPSAIVWEDSLISIQPPTNPLVINIKLAKNLIEGQQDIKQIFEEKGENSFTLELFKNWTISVIGYMCYQLCIPLEIRYYSDYYKEPFSFVIAVEVLDQIYDPMKSINNNQQK